MYKLKLSSVQIWCFTWTFVPRNKLQLTLSEEFVEVLLKKYSTLQKSFISLIFFFIV